MLTHFRANCLTPSLQVASMGGALVLYTLEAEGSCSVRSAAPIMQELGNGGWNV